MQTILLTGAASGLGASFLYHFSILPNIRIIAIDLHPITSHKTTLPENTTIQTRVVDISSPSSISTFAASLKNVPIHLLIHSIGIRGLVPSLITANPNDVAIAETWQAMDLATMMSTFQVNTAGTFLLLQALLPNLLSNPTPSKVVIMGSRMGSLSYNTTGGAYAYRASKAALNAIVKSFSIDVPEVVFTIFHPGRVETGLVQIKEEGAISADESVKEMMQVIDPLEKNDSGQFYDRFGEAIGW